MGVDCLTLDAVQRHLAGELAYHLRARLLEGAGLRVEDPKLGVGVNQKRVQG